MGIATAHKRQTTRGFVVRNPGMGTKTGKGGFGVVIIGEPKLQRKLARLPAQIRDRLQTRALRKAGKVVLQDAKRRVPKKSGAYPPSAPPYKSPGKLMRSLRLRMWPRRGGVLGFSVWTGHQFFRGEQFYGSFLEFGWTHIKTGNRHHYPFLRPAFDNNVHLVTEIFKAEIAALLREVGR